MSLVTYYYTRAPRPFVQHLVNGQRAHRRPQPRCNLILTTGIQQCIYITLFSPQEYNNVCMYITLFSPQEYNNVCI